MLISISVFYEFRPGGLRCWETSVTFTKDIMLYIQKTIYVDDRRCEGDCWFC